MLPAEVIVPVPVVEIFPLVESVPAVVIDQVAPPVSASVVPTVLFPKTIALALAEVPKLRFPVVPESIVKAVAAAVVRSTVWAPFSVTTPVEATLKFVDVKVNTPAEVTANVPEVTVERVRLFAVVDMVDAPRPVRAKAPDVPVKLIAPVVRISPLLAVNVCVDVRAPALVVVIPVAPIDIAAVFVVPIVIVPFAEVPVPAMRIRFPPVDVNPDSSPPFRVNAAPVPELLVLFPGWKTKAVGPLPAVVVISAVCPPANVTTPAEETLKLEDVKVKAFAPSVQVDGAAPVILSAPEELIVTTPVPEPIADVPVEVSVVNLPVEGVVKPIAVEFIPVAVVLKIDDVMVKALPPVSIDEAPSPERANAPEVPVRLIAPVVSVNPLLAVKRPADVTVPVPVVEIFPEVDKVPAVVIDQVAPPVSASVVPTVLFPKTIALALAEVPKLTFPVVPESIVKAVPAADLSVKAPPAVKVDPPAAPIPNAVAAAPMLTVVAFALKTVAVAAEVLRSPPLILMSPAVFISKAPS